MLHPFRGKSPKLDASVFYTPSSEIIGDVHIGADSSVWFNVTIRGDVHSIRIGKNTNIQDGSVLHVTHKISPLNIGHNVTVGHSAILHGCTIDDYCLIGMGAIVMDDVEVGKESLVGAGALVTQGMKIPPGSLVLGSPAKVIRKLRPQEIEDLHQSAKNYIQYVAWYREGEKNNEE